MSKCEKTGCDIIIYDRLWFFGHSVHLCSSCSRSWNRRRITDPVISAIGFDRSYADILLVRYENGGDIPLPDVKTALRNRENSSLDALNEFENWLAEPLETSGE